MENKCKVAVLVECHPFDVIGFQQMLDSFTDCECYVQAFDLFCQDKINRHLYDVVLYYNMSLPLLKEDSPVWDYLTNELGKTQQGIILLHHALLSFPKWQLWTDVSGVKIRCEDDVFQYHQNQRVEGHILDTNHPITTGITDFELLDETYIIGQPQEQGNHYLISTNNTNSIKHLAWTRSYRNSRVFCYASGHDNRTYSNIQFRTIVHNAIKWCAHLNNE